LDPEKEENDAIGVGSVADVTPKVFATKKGSHPPDPLPKHIPLVEDPARAKLKAIPLKKDIPLWGIYLVKPHGQLIAEGQKTLIVKSREFTNHIGEPLYLIEDHVCWGVIKLFQPFPMSPKDFQTSRGSHKISDKEAFEKWGWDKDKTLYGYRFKILEKYDTPLKVKLPKGVQTFVSAKNIHWVNVHSASMLSLFEMREDEQPDELFAVASEELSDRKLEPSEAVFLIRGWVEDYDESKPNDKQLADDYRITMGWYSSIRKGRKMYKRVGEESKQITLEECRSLALKIFKEMIKRGKWTFKAPDEYKKYSRELYEYLIRKVGKDKVPFKKELKKFDLDPKDIQFKDLENVDDVYCKSLSDDKLKELNEKVHEIYRHFCATRGSKKNCKAPEPMLNAHIFIWEAMRERNLKHGISDGLDLQTSLVVVKYPTPEFGVPQQQQLEDGLPSELSLKEAIAAFPDQILIDDPTHVFLCGGIVNRGSAGPDKDIDILFKQGWLHQPTIDEFLRAVKEKNPKVADKLHFVWDEDGPQIGMSVPMYRLAYVKVQPEEQVMRSPYDYLSERGATGPVGAPKLGKPYIPMKPKSGFGKSAFFDIDQFWTVWASKHIDHGIMVQKKYDGMRFSIQVFGGKVHIFTEDRRRDRVEAFKKSAAELQKHKLSGSFIVDAEMVEYDCKKMSVKDKENVCPVNVRESMIRWIAAKPENLDDEGVVFHVHDCIFLDGKAINQEGYLERWKAISKCFPKGLEHWRRVDGKVVWTMKAWYAATRHTQKLKGSEGSMSKDITRPYVVKYSGHPGTNRTTDMAKIKNTKEVDVMVTKVIRKQSKTPGKVLDQFFYECAFSVPCNELKDFAEHDQIRKGSNCYSYIGRTYSTREKIKEGDIITVRPIRVAQYEQKGKKHVTWMFPFFAGKSLRKQPMNYKDMMYVAEKGVAPENKALMSEVYRLRICPYWNDEKVCPLKGRFAGPRDDLSNMQMEYLKFPILCKFATHYKCRYVKSYYYGFRDVQIKSPTDEDDLNLIGEED
jgi:hypothetical protein